MGRRNGFPKPGDRISFAVPPAFGQTSKPRYGIVVERSCGKSGALRVRWEPDGNSRVSETWLADAGWHWAKLYLRLARSVDAIAAAPDALPVEVKASEDELMTPVRSAMRARLAAEMTGPETDSFAIKEWEAALVADPVLTSTEDWTVLLAAALAVTDHPEHVVAYAPGPLDSDPDMYEALLPPLTHAAEPVRLRNHQPSRPHRRVPESEPPLGPEDDILPGRRGRKKANVTSS